VYYKLTIVNCSFLHSQAALMLIYQRDCLLTLFEDNLSLVWLTGYKCSNKEASVHSRHLHLAECRPPGRHLG